ncbi:uncharacterized protein ISCGN_029653 [Ixodes scapularis]
MLDDIISYLEIAVEAFLERFCATYSDVRLIPKLHYLVHYMQMTEGLEPFHHQYWCLRFEDKHQYFENLATKVKNFCNPCQTLASRHQVLQRYHMMSVRKEPRIVCATEVNLQDLAACTQGLTEEATVLKASSISLDSGLYKVEDILVMHKT